MRFEQLGTGLGWPEGPTVLPDGRVAFVEPYRGQLSVWDPAGGITRLAYTAGSPNSSVLASDGSLYICQDGSETEQFVPPCIQRVLSGGDSQILASDVDGVKLTGPNDLTFGPDGRLYFTDPGRYDPQVKPDPGYVFVLQPDGSGHVLVELGRDAFPNGIAADLDGSIVWAESYSGLLRRWRPYDGSVVDITRLPDIEGVSAVPDGLALASDGNIYVTSVSQGGLHVVSRDGDQLGFVRVGVRPTNCAFNGSWLYVTDAGPAPDREIDALAGALWRIEVGVRGLRLHTGTVSPSSRGQAL